MILARRSFLVGLGSMLAAPAIVHAGNIMPIKGVRSLIVHCNDLGLSVAVDSNGYRFEAYTSHFKWKTSVTKEDFIFSQVDRDLADFSGNPTAFRSAEDIATLEGIAHHEGRSISDLCIVANGQPTNIFDLMRAA